MSALRLALGTAVVVVVSVFLVLDQSAENHPVLRVRNAADVPVTLYVEVNGQARDLGELSAGESRGLRVRADVQRVFGARFADGQAVLSGPLFFAPGQQVAYAIVRAGWQPEAGSAPTP